MRNVRRMDGVFVEEAEAVENIFTEEEALPKEEKTSKKGLRRVVRLGGNALIYVLITGGILFGVPHGLSKYLNTDFPMAAITSGSMWPVLKTGSLVFIEGIGGRDARVGDVVVFRNEDGSFTIHRVTKLGKNTLTTKGDANFEEDKPIKYETVVGRAVEIAGKPVTIPYIGSITVFASNLK